MGFTLTISEGKERGREYTFNQAEVCIGRTAENDLVLTEPGVSRRHVKFREEAGMFYVEDLGSANGTKLNGAPVTDDQIQDGDSIQVGPVVFSFQAIAEQGGDSTRIFDPADVAKKTAATKKARDVAARDAGGQKRAVTTVGPAVVKQPAPSGRPGAAARTSSPGGAGGANKALSKRPAPAPLAAKSASERARERRAADTLPAKIALWWSGASKGAKGGVVGALVVLLAGGGYYTFKAIKGDGPMTFEGDVSKQLFQIGPEPSATETWGYNIEGVTHMTVDKAQFEFVFPVTAKKAIATLHFTSAGIQKPEVIDVALNTVHIGFVQPSFGDQTKDQDINIPPKYLHPNEKNKVVFDNLKNELQPWYLAKVWVEVQQLPEDRPENLRRRAADAINVGDRAWEAHKIGAENTYVAWKAYQQAKLYLEAMDEKVDELDVVRGKIKEAKAGLDELCSKQMLKGVSAEQQGHPEQAIAIYKGALMFFPEKDHPCFQQLHDKLNNLE